MNSIQNQPMASGMPQPYSSLSDARVASYMRKQSVTATESLNAGLSIQTKDGDLVTLTSSSYSHLDASTYNSKGVLQTGGSSVITQVNQQEVTLASGESFTFSVVGDLSEEELADIEDIVKGIDEIIAEMAEGDMEEAVEKAMEMGSYDSISMYSADISYERTVEAMVETQTQVAAVESQEAKSLPEDESETVPATETIPQRRGRRRGRRNSVKNIDNFVEKMTEKLDKYADKQVAKSQKALNRLFDHHLGKEKEHKGSQVSAFNAIENAQKQLNKYIDKMFERFFNAEMF